MTTGAIHVLNGPNLDRLGTREPSVYGRETLGDIEARVRARAASLNVEIVFRQSNHEGALVEWINAATDAGAAIVINPAAYGHTSVALHDALRAAPGPVIEVHLSNPARREAFRHHSFVSSVATGVISGLGATGYELAVEAAARLLVERAATA
jgi:3-dehydroquinate dehydratase-2